MLWEPFGLERRRLRGPERGVQSGDGLDHCAVRERGPLGCIPVLLGGWLYPVEC